MSQRPTKKNPNKLPITSAWAKGPPRSQNVSSPPAAASLVNRKLSSSLATPSPSKPLKLDVRTLFQGPSNTTSAPARSPDLPAQPIYTRQPLTNGAGGQSAGEPNGPGGPQTHHQYPLPPSGPSTPAQHHVVLLPSALYTPPQQPPSHPQSRSNSVGLTSPLLTPSISSHENLPGSGSASPSGLNTNASAFVPRQTSKISIENDDMPEVDLCAPMKGSPGPQTDSSGPPSKIVIKNKDGTPIDLSALKKVSPEPEPHSSGWSGKVIIKSRDGNEVDLPALRKESPGPQPNGSGPPSKIVIKNKDGTKMDFSALKKVSPEPQPHSSAPSKIVIKNKDGTEVDLLALKNRRSTVRMETPHARNLRLAEEDAKRAKQKEEKEKKDAEKKARREEKERVAAAKREEEKEKVRVRKNHRDALIRCLTQPTVAPPNPLVEAERANQAAIHVDNSHQTNPIEWICADRKHLDESVLCLLKSPIITCDVSKVYPRLTLYALACIMFHSHLPEEIKGTKLSETQKELESWNAWDDITALAHHQTIRNYLLKSISEIHDDDPEGIYHEITLDKVLKLDDKAFDALLFQTLQSGAKVDDLVARRGQEAQNLLSLLQARLSLPLDPSLKRLPTRALIKLCRESGLYPDCMTLKGVKLAGEPLAGGSYGDIRKGLLGGREICIKVLRLFQRTDEVKLLKTFLTEAIIWRQLDHPNVLPFYGAFHLETRQPCFASPWMSNGNVTCFLESNPGTERLPLILDTAEGLHYLHTFEPRIIHGDLKGLNILVTDSGRACLADFGQASMEDSKSFAARSMTAAVGTLRWLAPELLGPSEDATCASSSASDVYAYACVCYEIFSGKVPFYEMTNYQAMNSVINGIRPPRPDTCHGLDDKIWSIIESCWTHQPLQRLDTGRIVKRLRLLSASSVDERPIDKFDSSFPPRTMYSQAEHPFSALPSTTDAAR